MKPTYKRDELICIGWVGSSCSTSDISKVQHKYIVNTFTKSGVIQKSRLRMKLHDKRDHFNFPIVNFLFICSNIPATIFKSFTSDISKVQHKYIVNTFTKSGVIQNRQGVV
jgi:hypothetical protein